MHILTESKSSNRLTIAHSRFEDNKSPKVGFKVVHYLYINYSAPGERVPTYYLKYTPPTFST